MSYNKFLFGPLGRMVEIPIPLSGMGFGLNRDTSTNELASGGRSVYRAPTSYKTFDMEWSGGTQSMGLFMDMFEGLQGPGPFYMFDPRSQGFNLLPPRWASSYQLAYTANGWNKPQDIYSPTSLSTRAAKFTAPDIIQSSDELSPFKFTIHSVLETPLYAKVWGTATGGATVRLRGLYGATRTIALDGTDTALASDPYSYLELVMPAKSTLTLNHMQISDAPSTYKGIDAAKPGRGVGAVQFTGNIQGNIVGTTIDRIGLSVEVTEVEE